jgi:hypothetical protein
MKSSRVGRRPELLLLLLLQGRHHHQVYALLEGNNLQTELAAPCCSVELGLATDKGQCCLGLILVAMMCWQCEGVHQGGLA